MLAAANAPNDGDKNLCMTAASAVTWSAILAGAFAATAISLVLVLLGSGFGLASVSPWAHAGVSAASITVAGVIWLILIQWVASALGGYLTGRMRCKWVGTDSDEVFFRDTAHGFLSWVVTTIFLAAFFASAVSSITGRATQAVTTVAAGVAAGANYEPGNMPRGPGAYFVDSLFRSDRMNSIASESDVRAEAARLLMRGMKDGSISDPDKVYLARLVASRTGLAEAEAVQRVDDVIAKINTAEEILREQADTARKATATISIFTALSMFIGAFVAAAAAALGGKRRDEY